MQTDKKDRKNEDKTDRQTNYINYKTKNKNKTKNQIIIQTAKLPKLIFVDFEIILDPTSFLGHQSNAKIHSLISGSAMAQNKICKSAEVEVDDIPHEKLRKF